MMINPYECVMTVEGNVSLTAFAGLPCWFFRLPADRESLAAQLAHANDTTPPIELTLYWGRGDTVGPPVAQGKLEGVIPPVEAPDVPPEAEWVLVLPTWDWWEAYRAQEEAQA